MTDDGDYKLLTIFEVAHPFSYALLGGLSRREYISDDMEGIAYLHFIRTLLTKRREVELCACCIQNDCYFSRLMYIY